MLRLPEFITRHFAPHPPPASPEPRAARPRHAPPVVPVETVETAASNDEAAHSDDDVVDADIDEDDVEIVEASDLGVVDMGAVPQRLRTLFSDPKYQPPTPPTVAMELLVLARKSEVDVGAAAELFKRDPMLAARVLKVARSPLYGSASVPTIRDAIVRLGTRRLSHVVLEAAMDMRVFRSTTWGAWMERVRRHSVAVGHIAGHIAHLGDVDVDQALVAGLMHDVGTAAAIGAVGDKHHEFQDVDPAALCAAFDEIHTEIGAVVADAWHLSAEVKMVIANHHSTRGHRQPMLAVVVLAEAFAIDAGVGSGTELDPFHDEDLRWAKETLNIDDDRLVKIRAELEPLMAML
jgi:putative nucleotidyltransferase with HDIG domain